MSRGALGIEADELAVGRPYPERSEPDPAWHDRLAGVLLARILKPVRDRLRDPAKVMAAIIAEVERHDRDLRMISDQELAVQARAMRPVLRRRGYTPDLAGKSFALVREAAARTLGHRHYDVQLIAGWALLQGRLVEMATGEGKTMAATLPASTVALAGYPVHVITVNDYLAERDAAEMGPLYRMLGLTVGAVVQGMAKPDRRQAYAESITYCTNKELAFDYLRDRIAVSQRSSRLHLSVNRMCGIMQREDELVLRGLHFGIVDEADSIFIDEARTPLILSATVAPLEEKAQCAQALALAQQLTPGADYAADLAERRIWLTAAGESRLEELTEELEGVWASVRVREELVTQALTALILYRRDQHYVVSDGKVQIVDESTGRLMPDRSWERGQHQMIEVKEGCEPTARRETLARLTYQRLFRRYLRLAGMTGTGREVEREIGSVYGLDVVRVPLHRPLRRRYGTTRICATAAGKWRAVADVVARVSREGRPVLVGTRSVEASEQLSAVLEQRGIRHELLNAKQDSLEAAIVAQAGQPGRVTVATNMAGRGTDIRLGPGVAEQGGLHVILTEYHETQRVDRQLFGRCARQGDPGSCEAIVSLDDDIFLVNVPRLVPVFQSLRLSRLPTSWLTDHVLRRLAQSRAERRSTYVRMQNLKQDKRLDRVLAFSGRSE